MPKKETSRKRSLESPQDFVDNQIPVIYNTDKSSPIYRDDVTGEVWQKGMPKGAVVLPELEVKGNASKVKPSVSTESRFNINPLLFTLGTGRYNRRLLGDRFIYGNKPVINAKVQPTNNLYESNNERIDRILNRLEGRTPTPVYKPFIFGDNDDYYVIEGRPRRFKGGGSIHIKPSKRGTFTAAASRHGMGVQEFASRVLRNKDSYSPAMVKKANFARNASKWNH